MARLSENLQCKKRSFLTKWWDPLDLSLKKNLLDMVYMHPGGVRTAMALFFLQCHLRYTLVDMVDKVDKYKVDNSHCVVLHLKQ